MSSDIRNRSILASTSEASFETVFTRYYSLVYQLAYRCVGQSDEAEDIAQEVFLRYHNVPPKAESEAERRSWLCRVATMVRSILAEMPERQQAYILLRSTGLSYAEIAQATGVATASVGALLARAEREFRRRYHERVTAPRA